MMLKMIVTDEEAALILAAKNANDQKRQANDDEEYHLANTVYTLAMNTGMAPLLDRMHDAVKQLNPRIRPATPKHREPEPTK